MTSEGKSGWYATLISILLGTAFVLAYYAYRDDIPAFFAGLGVGSCCALIGRLILNMVRVEVEANR